MDDYGLLKVIHPSIGLDEDLIWLFNSVRKVLSWFELLFLEESYMKWAVYFLALIDQSDMSVSEKICARLDLAPKYTVIFNRERFEVDRKLYVLERSLPHQNSRIYKQLHGLRTELLLYLMAKTRKESVKRSISRYFTHLRYITPAVMGKDLIKMGIPPGPIYRKLFDSVLTAKLDGILKTKAEEINYVRELAGNTVQLKLNT